MRFAIFIFLGPLIGFLIAASSADLMNNGPYLRYWAYWVPTAFAVGLIPALLTYFTDRMTLRKVGPSLRIAFCACVGFLVTALFEFWRGDIELWQFIAAGFTGAISSAVCSALAALSDRWLA